MEQITNACKTGDFSLFDDTKINCQLNDWSEIMCSGADYGKLDLTLKYFQNWCKYNKITDDDAQDVFNETLGNLFNTDSSDDEIANFFISTGANPYCGEAIQSACERNSFALVKTFLSHKASNTDDRYKCIEEAKDIVKAQFDDFTDEADPDYIALVDFEDYLRREANTC